MELLRSEPFTVSRVQLARAAAEAYVRNFWWFIVPGPVFGLVVVAVSNDRLLQAIGALGVLWPISIPTRAYFITSGIARRLSKPTTLLLVDEGLLFEGERAQLRVGYGSLRSVSVRHDVFVLSTRRYEAIVVPLGAFAEPDQARFLSILQERGVRVNAKGFLEL